MTWRYFTSLQEAVDVFENFTINIANVAKDMANMEEVKTLRKSIFEVAEAVEKFALNYGKQHLSGIRLSKRIVYPKMGEVAAYCLGLKFISLLLNDLLTDRLSSIIS